MNENITAKKKYALAEFLNKKLSQDARKKAWEDLPKLLGISDRQFARFVQAEADDIVEARPSYLMKIAAYLSGATGDTVTINDLLIF